MGKGSSKPREPCENLGVRKCVFQTVPNPDGPELDLSRKVLI